MDRLCEHFLNCGNAQGDGNFDPDMLEVGNPGLTITESGAHFSLWCMLAAPLMAGNDLREMTTRSLKS
jgi:alpha-galactosidase